VIGNKLADEIAAAVQGDTVPRAFYRTVESRGSETALRWRDSDGWAEWSWQEYADRACRLAAGLQSLGVERGDSVLLMLRNRPEFHVADLASLLIGATTVSVYNSSAPEQLAYIAANSRARAAIVEDTDFLGRLLKVRSELSELRHVVVVDSPGDLGAADLTRFKVLLEQTALPLAEAVTTSQPDDVATIIYTSGTTGPPKGVLLTHTNVLWTNESFRRCLAPMSWTGRRFVSYLPMAHIAERMTTHYDHIVFGSVVTTCPDATDLGSYLRDVRPEVFFGPPRVFEKFAAGVRAAVGAHPEQAGAFEAARDAGRRVRELELSGTPVPKLLAASWDEHRRGVLGSALGLVGLDRCEMAITGAAPVPTDVVHFFLEMGLPLSEIYGLSETCGPHTWEPYRVRPGTVGPGMPGCEVKVESDGEVLLRGGNIFAGYLRDTARTQEARDEHGWLHSGDLGRLDDAGFLTIVDRKKDIIITAGGKNVSPANLEAALKRLPLVGQACVVGDGRPYLAAIVVLDPEAAAAWATANDATYTSLGELSQHPAVRAELERGLAELNARFAQPERIKRLVVLGEEWQPDSVELTPTLKLKRRAVLDKYADQIESLYPR
jgi:long-chain acyl-CoA synthetase